MLFSIQFINVIHALKFVLNSEKIKEGYYNKRVKKNYILKVKGTGYYCAIYKKQNFSFIFLYNLKRCYLVAHLLH